MIHSFSLPYIRGVEKLNPREVFGYVPWIGFDAPYATHRCVFDLMRPISTLTLVDMLTRQKWGME